MHAAQAMGCGSAASSVPEMEPAYQEEDTPAGREDVVVRAFASTMQASVPHLLYLLSWPKPRRVSLSPVTLLPHASVLFLFCTQLATVGYQT